MKIPGFTAEASLYKAGESHFMNGMLTALINDGEIIPQATKDCYKINGNIICLPRAYRRWPDIWPWGEYPDPQPWDPSPDPWSEVPGTAISI